MYIRKKLIYGIDLHDVSMQLFQVKNDDGYFFNNEDVNNGIIHDLKKIFPYVAASKFKDAIENKSCFTFPILKENEDGYFLVTENNYIEEDGIIKYANEATFYGNNLKCHINYNWGETYEDFSYICKDIPYQDVCYIVVQNFLNPDKGVSSIDRIYHEPFFSDKEAEEYIEKTNFPRIKSASCIELMIMSYSEIMNSTWYKNNMEIIEKIENEKLNINEIPFSVYVDEHLEYVNKEIEKINHYKNTYLKDDEIER